MKPVVKFVIEPISVPEMREARRSTVKYVQEKHFKEEIECLNRNQDIVTVIPSQRHKGGSVKRGSRIFGLDPVLVDRSSLKSVKGNKTTTKPVRLKSWLKLPHIS